MTAQITKSISIFSRLIGKFVQVFYNAQSSLPLEGTLIQYSSDGIAVDDNTSIIVIPKGSIKLIKVKK